ncbi:MAG: hypothetical protein N3D12_02510 [Candidatus Methanomethyliaceae archaeon]|nr:hypothetical protein [Candidatus Methanomethyliaceae archaeon]
MSEDNVIENLMRLKGIIKVVPLTQEDRAEIERLEREAEGKVLMGLCKGMNLGVREALRKKTVYACITNASLRWPKTSLVKIVCGEETIGEDKYDENELERLKSEGNLVVGNIVFYKDKIRLMRENIDKISLLMLPLKIPELEGLGMVIGSPSPPADLYLKKKLGASEDDPNIGTVIVGVGGDQG